MTDITKLLNEAFASYGLVGDNAAARQLRVAIEQQAQKLSVAEADAERWRAYQERKDQGDSSRIAQGDPLEPHAAMKHQDENTSLRFDEWWDKRPSETLVGRGTARWIWDQFMSSLAPQNDGGKIGVLTESVENWRDNCTYWECRSKAADDVLRSLSSWLGQGLMAGTELLDYTEAEARIREGVDTIIKVEASRVVGTAPLPDAVRLTAARLRSAIHDSAIHEDAASLLELLYNRAKNAIDEMEIYKEENENLRKLKDVPASPIGQHGNSYGAAA